MINNHTPLSTFMQGYPREDWVDDALCAQVDPEACIIRTMGSSPRPFAVQLDLRNADAAFRDRFWSKVDQRGPDECWEWTRYCKPNGYGQFTVSKGVFQVASRVAYALTFGLIPDRHAVCHTCDNPPCCNPAHLFAATQVINTLDSVNKGRANRSHGSEHRSARLSPEAVRIIRSTPIEYGTKARLAREFAVSRTAIRRVLAGVTWAA